MQKIAPGAHRVHMLGYVLAKDCAGTSPLRKMTMLYGSFNDAIGIRTVYASVNGKRISLRKAINRDDRTVTLSFPRSAHIGICSGKTVDIFADFSRNAEPGSTHRLDVEFASDVISDEGSSSATPQTGEWVEISK